MYSRGRGSVRAAWHMHAGAGAPRCRSSRRSCPGQEAVEEVGTEDLESWPRGAEYAGVLVTAQQLVGREEELGAILRVLEAPELLPGVAVLSGEAGIGKTALWLAGIDAATADGYRIMSSRPSEAETTFSFAGLTDLLDTAAVHVLPKLPPIQQRALEAALLLGDSEIHADERAVAAAFLGALRLLAADGPLLPRSRRRPVARHGVACRASLRARASRP